MIKTITCQFPDGSRSDVNVEDVALYIGRGVWGIDFLNHLADDHKASVYLAQLDENTGKVIVESGQAA